MRLYLCNAHLTLFWLCYRISILILIKIAFGISLLKIFCTCLYWIVDEDENDGIYSGAVFYF